MKTEGAVVHMGLAGKTAPAKVFRAVTQLPRPGRVSMVVGFGTLRTACDALLKEGWRVTSIDLLKDEPGCVISASASDATA